MASGRYAGFKPETLEFLRELKKNNNRDWFKENKSRYEEQVLDVALHFIQSMQDPLREITPHFTAIPKRMGGSLTRPPRGFDEEHPMIEDIKRKSFIAVKNMNLGDVLDPQFQRKVETAFKAATPYMEFLCKAVRVPF